LRNESYTPKNARLTYRHVGRRLACCSLLLGLVVTCDCDPGNELGRLPISGTVLLDGKPMDSGDIQFRPHGQRGVGSGTIITDGHYEIGMKKGLPAGKYLVRIYSPVLIGSKGASRTEGLGGAINSVERVPEKYNTNSEEVITISSQEPNTFDFSIEAK